MPTDDQILQAPSLQDIKQAQSVLQNALYPTPVLENAELTQPLGFRLLLKAENLQRTGSFKFRGAYNRISGLTDQQKKRGIMAYSSGNHAQAVALSARLHGISALIVMPDGAPVSKMEQTRKLGASIITYNRATQSREDLAAEIQAQNNRVMVPPNEDQRVMAGAGTVALSLFQHTPDIDSILVPCGGGGLTAATAIVAKDRAKVYAVEPEEFDDTKRSLIAGKRLRNPVGRTTICDAIMTDTPGALTFPINQTLLAGALTVSDDQVRTAMLFAFIHFKIVIEPGAAVGLAAVLANPAGYQGQTVAVIVTGGNVDAPDYQAALALAKPKELS